MKVLRILLTSLLLATPLQRISATVGDADARAAETEARMTDDERFQLLHGIMPLQLPGGPPVAAGIKPSSGRVFGIPRLGIPDLAETDASLGVTNPFQSRPGDVATALPAGLALAATFNPQLAFDSGAMVGAEARAKGFNVLLGGGVNLTRDWFNGRNFEYLGEDPLLAGSLAGEAIRGAQSAGVVATVKHFSLNAQETLRDWVDARIDEAAHRESDLLAFQLAIERGQPGAVMCAYNRVNGVHACGNDHLLNRVLKRDWGFKGWVMSDWGAVDDVAYFNAGLDQQSGATLDAQIWFDGPLRSALAAGAVSRDRLADAVRRILRSLYAVGADRPLAEAPIDYAAHAEIARRVAAEGIVLLKNDGILPLPPTANILIVGGHADIGVMAGWGSSQVTPVGGYAATIPVGGPSGYASLSQQHLTPSSPMLALAQRLPGTKIEFDSGYFPEAAAARARRADLVIVFATQWQGESLDVSSMALPQGQDALITAIATANPQNIVVLETGNPVNMPWLDKVRAVVQAWYPGQQGGSAIADVLTGKVNPSGRLPMTFPVNEQQTPRPRIPGLGEADGTATPIAYTEGANVGYRWFATTGQRPLFPFGHGLSFTRFEHGPLTVTAGETIRAQFTVKNIGGREGADAPQLYLLSAGKRIQRLVGFDKVTLRPGERREIRLDIDPRLLADWSGDGWHIRAGSYAFAVGRSAAELGPAATVELAERRLKP